MTKAVRKHSATSFFHSTNARWRLGDRCCVKEKWINKNKPFITNMLQVVWCIKISFCKILRKKNSTIPKRFHLNCNTLLPKDLKATNTETNKGRHRLVQDYDTTTVADSGIKSWQITHKEDWSVKCQFLLQVKNASFLHNLLQYSLQKYYHSKSFFLGFEKNLAKKSFWNKSAKQGNLF